MKLNELNNLKLNKAVAYIVGLSFPLFKTITIDNHHYMIGSVNHNPDKIDYADLSAHYLSILELFKECFCENIEILSNQNDKKNINLKTGFSILINIDGLTDEQSLQILSSITNKILKASEEIKKEFVKACFDGRSSWDTTAHYISLDVDRNYEKQDLIKTIIESFGIGVNINRRSIDHEKNDQIRIKKDSVEKFITNIGLYSICRMKIIQKGMNK